MISSETYQLPLEELLNRILISRQVSGSDFNLLSLIFFSNLLTTEEDRRTIERIFYAIRRGWFKLVDISESEVSMIHSWLKTAIFG